MRKDLILLQIWLLGWAGWIWDLNKCSSAPKTEWENEGLVGVLGEGSRFQEP